MPKPVVIIMKFDKFHVTAAIAAMGSSHKILTHADLLLFWNASCFNIERSSDDHDVIAPALRAFANGEQGSLQMPYELLTVGICSLKREGYLFNGVTLTPPNVIVNTIGGSDVHSDEHSNH